MRLILYGIPDTSYLRGSEVFHSFPAQVYKLFINLTILHIAANLTICILICVSAFNIMYILYICTYIIYT